MAYQKLKVEGPDGEVTELEIMPRDALIWEKTGKGNPSILTYLALPSVTEAYRLAHIAMKRQHQYEGSLKDFEEGFEVRIDFDEEEPEPDPTQSGA